MLVLIRKEGRALVIGDHVTVRVIRIDGGKVTLGVEAPRALSVRRDDSPKASVLGVGSALNPRREGQA